MVRGVASKRAASKAAGRIAGEAEKVSEGFRKLRGFKKIKFKTQRLVRKFLPKKRYRKMAVVDVEELAKKQGLKPNLQLFAEDNIGEYVSPSGGGGITSRISINGKEITFGHGGRHLIGTRLNINAVNKKLAEVVSKLKIKKGEFYKGQVKVNDVVIEFTSFGVSDDVINIGTYYPK